MQFTFNEGHIQLPSQWQDQSMQVLVSTDNSGINLVITREAVPQGTLTPELYQETLALYQGKLDGTVAKLAMRQPFVLFKGLTFQKLCLPGAFRPGDHHNKMLRPGLCVVHASPQYL